MPLPRYFHKLAHKHYSHFYETANFHDHKERKKLYSPFKQGEENKQIADLFIQYKKLKDEKIQQLTTEWEEYIQKIQDEDFIGHALNESQTDFQKSGANALYDLKNKNNIENF